VARRDLERFVYDERVGLTYDMRGGAPGREVLVHPRPSCISAAAWAGFARQLGESIDAPEGEELIDTVRQGLSQRIQDRLGEIRRLGDPVVGIDPTERAMDRGAIECVIVAEDADSRRAEKFLNRCRESDVPVFERFQADALGNLCGRGRVVAVGLEPGKKAEEVGRDLEKLACIEYEPDG
jgi:ribosomal protein L7Ae-like RNA K-turn-binding protein